MLKFLGKDQMKKSNNKWKYYFLFLCPTDFLKITFSTFIKAHLFALISSPTPFRVLLNLISFLPNLLINSDNRCFQHMLK